jgi:RNA polymerase sigma-70 factor (ECF subfamily)
VLAAGVEDPARAQEALAKLCQTYWYPLYAFARGHGYSPETAEDLTQGFFVRLLKRRDLARGDRVKGRFRNFLLTAFRHFIADEFDKATALKRGGGQVIISYDAQAAEERFLLEPTDSATPDRLYDRRWALMALEQASVRLEAEYREAHKEQLFSALEGFLTAADQQSSYAQIGERLGLTESAVKSALHRLRQRQRELIREQIAQTVATRREIDEEVRHLIEALSH